eukprot:UN22552
MQFRYVNKKFSNQYKATIGADFLTRRCNTRTGSSLCRYGILLDRKGFRVLVLHSTVEQTCCVLVYDVNSMKSFDNLNN